LLIIRRQDGLKVSKGDFFSKLEVRCLAMSGTSIGSASIFTSTAQAGRTNDADWYQLNGVDASLTQQYSDVAFAASTNPINKGNEGAAAIQARLDFVNSLTPAQLKENAGFQMGAGWNKSGNYTWQEIKDYGSAIQGLENKVKSLMIPGVDQSQDPTLNSIYSLIGGLNQNTPGALEQATKYLAASDSADVIKLSAGAMSAIATGSAATAASTALLKKQSSDASASDSGASIALAVLNAVKSSTQEAKTLAGIKGSAPAPDLSAPGVDFTV